eukprot:CAMPEP_0185598314 /NCGR_PEP_ID=MMETSP0434-20130131/81915_1 /TAXON_ID=626734 ORGANISM="Favella taraikaensis, Strain Fe Narragansett Bay" /NCGR_SAMPLE_ID=MMETSP0434 /ASSEMBLY_ACC=CAM_ASM_000379 /LENGTH=38 /DNA_ID= /DNA_START= /DNA_END= /DNA_ORIENTATION=
MSEQDNLLKYQISDNKEENELLEDLIGSEEPHRQRRAS